MLYNLVSCPLCRKKFPDELHALSRVDNKTHICSDCGTWEAMAPMRNTWGLMAMADLMAKVLKEIQNGN